MPGETANNGLENDGGKNVRMTVALFFFRVFIIVIFAFLLLLLKLLITSLVEIKDPLAELFLFIIGCHI